MKKKMREFLIAVMLVVMAAALCITLISCGSSEKSDDAAKAKTQTETVLDEDDGEAAEDESEKTDADISSKSDTRADSKSKEKTSGKSDSKSASDKKDGSSKFEKTDTDNDKEPVTEPTTKAPDVCYITIENYCSSKAITLQGGDTVYSVLCRSGASVSGSGHYVKGINGKFEFDEGPTSGWTYYVNGSKPGVSCGSYSVKAGDNIKWDYVTSY